MLDEPTRGLDYTAKAALSAALLALAARGRWIVVATHNVEFVAEAADAAVVMADDEIVAQGPISDIARSTPAFAPQIVVEITARRAPTTAPAA